MKMTYDCASASMPELLPCPECGAAATVLHLFDRYDNADFGYSAGCPRYRLDDGRHKLCEKVSAFTIKEAVELWNRKAEENDAKRNAD